MDEEHCWGHLGRYVQLLEEGVVGWMDATAMCDFMSWAIRMGGANIGDGVEDQTRAALTGAVDLDCFAFGVVLCDC